MVFGLDINDMVAFMTSPIVNLIDRLSQPDIFQNIEGSPGMAINMVQGIVGVKKFLHGNINLYNPDPTVDTESMSKIKYVKQILQGTDIWDKVKEFNGITDDVSGLPDTMKAFIKYATENKDINLREMFNERDTEVNYYLNYCQDLIDKLRVARDQYDSLDDFNADIEEFAKLYNDSNELSSISSAWLGLNQGIPTAEVDILKRLSRMSSTVTDRETLLKINDADIYPSEDASEKVINKAQLKKAEIINSLLENNPTLNEELIEQRLNAAHEEGLINNFDIIKYLTDEEYAKQCSDYYDIIKSTVNVFELMDSLPQYKQILNLFKAVVIGKNTLSAKSRFIRELSKNSEVKFDNIDKVVKYVDNLNVINFTQQLPIITLHENVDGFDAYYKDKQISSIDLGAVEGLLSFRHFIEHEFLDYLKTNYKQNSLVRHLQVVPTTNSSVLATDIDLLNPNATLVSRQAYNDILRGMSEFEGIQFNQDFTIADMLQLYNIIVNKNQYGAERLTTAFKVCKNPNNILNQFLNFTADQDYLIDGDLDYSKTDLLIALAPTINEYSEGRHTESFIKVQDDSQGYILKYYNPQSNNYYTYEVIPTYKRDESGDAYMNRLKNYMENTPFDMPDMFKNKFLVKAIDYDENNSDETEVKDQIANILVKFITNSRAQLVKDCI